MTLLTRLSLLIACVVMVAGCGEGIDLSAFAESRARGQFERTLTVNGPVDLSVRTGSGDIDIRVGPDDRVRVVGRITAGNHFLGDPALERIRRIESAPPIQQSGSVIRIGETGDDAWYDNVSISYEISVPANTQVASHSGSGHQIIGSLDGAVMSRAGSGNIQIRRAGGGLDAQAGSGDIRAVAVSGAVRAQVGSGNIDITQIAKGDVDIQAGSGDVTVVLPGDAAVHLVLRTGSGSIDTPYAVHAQGTGRRNHVEGTVRGGGNRVDIRTGSGAIQIR